MSSTLCCHVLLRCFKPGVPQSLTEALKLFKLAYLLALFVGTMSSESNQPLFRQIANFMEGGWELSYDYNGQDKGNQQDSLKWPKASKMQTKQPPAAPRQKKKKE